MASHGSHIKTVDEKLQLGTAGNGIKLGALGVGVVLLIVAVVLGFFVGNEEVAVAHRARFYHAYLVGFAFCLSICLGGLFFSMMQHMVKVGWSVNVRRVPEALAATLPFLGLLSIPLLVPVWGDRGGELYPWAVEHIDTGHHAAASPSKLGAPLDLQLAEASPGLTRASAVAASEADRMTTESDPAHSADAAHGDGGHGDGGHGEGGHGEEAGAHARYDHETYDHLAHLKQPWLSKSFFTIRIAFYFAVWAVLAYIFVGRSKKQDVTGDIETSRSLSKIAPVGIILFALTLTFGVFDLIMSLDHHWYSTIFGVYIFAGGMIGMFSLSIVSYQILQAKGFLKQSINVEHFHDLGKFLFAFIFFWGYIAFSQFMLQWYASIPEELFWWSRRGVTSADVAGNTISYTSGFAAVSIALLFGHFVIPFAYMISRHIKRSREALLVGACWMLVAHFIDMYWLIMPEYNNGEFILDFAVIATALGVIALFVWHFVHQLGRGHLRPIGDPRTPESLAFTNM